MRVGGTYERRGTAGELLVHIRLPIDRAFLRRACFKMSSLVTLSTSDIILISLNVATLLLVILSYFKAHTGDCRGAFVTKTKTPDGCITREAKLSMHEAQHDNMHELQTLRLNH